MKTANSNRFTAFLTALTLTMAVNGTTLAMFDTVAHAGQTTPGATAIALNTVTITAKRG